MNSHTATLCLLVLSFGIAAPVASVPSLFWGYLAGSTAIPWDNDFLVKADFATKHKNLPVRLFVEVGGAEQLVTPGLGFVRTFSARNYNGLRWDARVIEGGGHAGVKPEFYNCGLRFLFH